MGFFDKRRTDGKTRDGATDERKGIIDRIKYDGLADELVWKFPYENITAGAQLIVNQSQEAVFLKGGAVCDVFGPGTHTLSAANIPVLQKLINLPFGGNTPFVAEVWFVNRTVKRSQKWGTKTPVKLRDPHWGIVIPVRGYGRFGMRVVDSAVFLGQIIGTQHITTTEDILTQFESLIVSKVTDSISKYIVDRRVSVIDIPAKIEELSALCKTKIVDEFLRYGLELTSFEIMSINYPDDDPGVIQINKAIANRMQRDIEGYSYGQERSFDILESATANEGGSSGIMDAGIGLGMGLGVGGVLRNQMDNIGGVMNTAANQSLPQQAGVSFHIVVNGQQEGPYDITQLVRLVRSAQITCNTVVWRPGMPGWKKAGLCPELLGLFDTEVPPPPPPES